MNSIVGHTKRNGLLLALDLYDVPKVRMFKKLILIMSVRPLPPELADKARHELNEDPKRLEDGIQHLKEWISKQPHLRARTGGYK